VFLENGAKITDALTSLLRHRRSSTTPYSFFIGLVTTGLCFGFVLNSGLNYKRSQSSVKGESDQFGKLIRIFVFPAYWVRIGRFLVLGGDLHRFFAAALTLFFSPQAAVFIIFGYTNENLMIMMELWQRLARLMQGDAVRELLL
jgi:hypothetical protein